MLGLGIQISKTKVVGADGPPINTSLPTISGTNVVGNTLTVTNGRWKGKTPITYAYQWMRNGVNISGATSSTYNLTSIDSSKIINCSVTATNSIASTSVTSNDVPVYESEYKAVLDYAINILNLSESNLPTISQRLLQNALLLTLKTIGAWTKLDTFANFATNGSNQFALIDWRRLTTYTATATTFLSNRGFSGNGTSAFINTNFIPSTNPVGQNYQATDASRYVFMDSAISTGPLDGNDSANQNGIFRSGGTGNNRINQSSGTTTPVFSYTSARGMKVIRRTTSTDLALLNYSLSGGLISSTAATNTVAASLPTTNQTILKLGAVGEVGT